MATYKNKTIYQKSITLEGGDTLFLRKGQKITTSKKVKKMDDGIVEEKEKASTKKTSTSTSNTNTQENKESE